MNLGGAKDRPALEEMWNDAQAIMKGESSKPREMYSKTSLMTGLREKIRG